MQPDNLTIRIKDLRKERSLTQEALAEALGLSRQSVNAMEAGRCLPSLPVALELARFFDVSVQTIFRAQEEGALQHAIVAYMGGAPTTNPAVNIAQDDTAVYIEATLPGYTREDVLLELTADTLILSGEKQQSRMSSQGFVRQEFTNHRFRRLLQLPSAVIVDQAQAKMEDGILYIVLLKPQTTPVATTKIEIS